jgi:hypothetical protein
VPEPAESPRGQPVAGRQPDVFATEALEDLLHQFAIFGIALVVGVVLGEGAFVGRAVDVVDVAIDRWKAAGDVGS